MADDLLVFAFFFIPFLNISPVACGTVVLSSLISIALSICQGRTKDNLSVNTLSILLLLFMAYSMLFSLPVMEDTKSYVRLVFQLRLPMLLLPIAFLFRGMASFHVRKAMASFALGAYGTAFIVIIVFICSLFSSFDNIPYSSVNLLSCFRCVVSMLIHRTYMCFNIITAFLIFYFLLSDSWSRKKVILFTIIFLFTAFFVFMTDARIALFSFLWILVAIVIREARRFFRGWLFYGVAAAVVLCIVIVLSQSTRVNNVLVSLMDGSRPWQDLDPRFRIWSYGWTLFSEGSHPWIGAGAGSSIQMLADSYASDAFSRGMENNWNMHNQFLEVLVENGILGLVLLVALLVTPLFLKSSHRLFFWIWIPALVINLFFESMLSRAYGTYPITAILLLAGFIDEKELKFTNPQLCKVLTCLALLAITIFSVKYVLKDKTEVFNSFQRNFTQVDELPGDVPEDLKGNSGLRIDSQTATTTWREWATMWYIFDQKALNPADQVTFSVYAYISEDFDAERLFISIEERENAICEISYDYDKRGTWQLLEYTGSGLQGNSAFLISCFKNHATDFSNVKGFAIFAKPKIIIHPSK